VTGSANGPPLCRYLAAGSIHTTLSISLYVSDCPFRSFIDDQSSEIRQQLFIHMWERSCQVGLLANGTSV